MPMPMQVKSTTSRPILLWLFLCSSSAVSAGRRVSIHLPQHAERSSSSLCIPNPLLSSASASASSNRGISTSDFFTCREFLSDVPSDFEGFVSVGTPAACLRNHPDLDSYSAERRIENAGGGGEEEASSRGGVGGILRAVRRRADSRAELARTLFERRRRTLNTAAHLAADAARSSPAGRLLSRTASVYSARDAHLTTIRNRVAPYYAGRRGGHQPESSSSSRHNAANSILTEEERIALVERTSRLLDSVRRALAQKHLWEEVTDRDGVKVWRTHADVKNLPADGRGGHTAASDGATILSEAYMNAPPHEVYELFMNDDRVHEYNDNCVSLADIERVDESTKINWCATGKFGPFKARDFVTLVHFRKLSDEEGYLSLAANVEHSKLPPADGFVRSQIQLSATFMRPVPGEPNKTQFIQMTQVGQLGGVADSAMAKRITANLAEKAPVDFMRKFDAALSRSTPAPRPKVRTANNRLPFSGVGSLSQV